MKGIHFSPDPSLQFAGPSASGVAGTGGVGGFGRASKALTVNKTFFGSFFYRNANTVTFSLPGRIQNLLPQEPGSKLVQLLCFCPLQKNHSLQYNI